MRVVATHDVPDYLGAFAVLGVSRQVLLPHRVQDAALDGFEAVAHVGQRARRDDRQGIVEIARLCRFVQGDRAVTATGRIRTASIDIGLRKVEEGLRTRTTTRSHQTYLTIRFHLAGRKSVPGAFSLSNIRCLTPLTASRGRAGGPAYEEARPGPWLWRPTRARQTD